MKNKATLLFHKPDMFYTDKTFSLLKEEKRGVYITLLPFSSCRSYMCDTLFKLKNPTYKWDAAYPFNFDYKKGNIYIGITLNIGVMGETFFKNLHLLHEKETIAKVRKSKVMKTENPRYIVVEGSGYWKDSCWKMMLYTFYLKTLCYYDPLTCDPHYWQALKKFDNEQTLLSKVKCKKEIFHPSVYGENNDRGMHSNEGFVSICSGLNKPMADYLGVKV